MSTTRKPFFTMSKLFVTMSIGASFFTGLVAALVAPFEPGFSARVTTGVIDLAFTAVALLLGALAVGFIGWRQDRKASNASKEAAQRRAARGRSTPEAA